MDNESPRYITSGDFLLVNIHAQIGLTTDAIQSSPHKRPAEIALAKISL